MPEEHIPIAVKLREAAEQAKISKASLCAKCDKVCPRVSAVIAKYTEEYGLMEDKLERLKQQIPKPKPNLLGAGRKPKVTPKIIKCVLKLKEDGLSFGDIAKAINEVSDVTHYIRVDFLEQVVLQEVRRLTKFASRYENEFTELIVGHSKHVSEIERKIKEKELNKLIARDKELDRLFECTYEDNASGKLSDERYMKITKSYELEQGELSEKIKGLRAELEKSTNKSMTADTFIKIVRKYTKAKKLSEIMLNELVERIEVFHAEIIDGVKTQRLIIHYNCVGIIDIPSDLPLPEPEITINTRQGVWVNYAT